MEQGDIALGMFFVFFESCCREVVGPANLKCFKSKVLHLIVSFFELRKRKREGMQHVLHGNVRKPAFEGFC